MILLSIFALWSVFATVIYLIRNWNRKQTLHVLFLKTLFVMFINLIACPICVFFNLVTLKKKLQSIKKTAPRIILAPQPLQVQMITEYIDHGQIRQKV